MKHARPATKPSKRTISRPENLSTILQLKDSARRRELVAVIGTGSSICLTNNTMPALSWRGLIENGFEYGVTKGKIARAQAKTWGAMLKSNDPDDLLSAAEFVGRKLGAPGGDLYARWLEGTLGSAEPSSKSMSDAVKSLQAAGIPLCTLNYDKLLERVTGLPSINLNEPAKVAAWMRDGTSGILHLHGSWDVPASCILGIRDYEATLGNDIRDLIQRSLASFHRLLFVGCGETFADPNFSALVQWLRQKMKAAVPQHYALVRDSEAPTRHADPTWQGFVEPLSYGVAYQDLPGFLLKHFPLVKVADASIGSTFAPSPAVGRNHARLIRDYCAFLTKDCGQMTIEGVRADLDTAQRRFDLERLFVPLKVLPCPPEIPDTDPQREQMLVEWQKKNEKPVAFGSVLGKHPRLALLALPGGGKSLLLKRLAVAYADSARRSASDDDLPNIDVTPVLIRCREWRDLIQAPIPTLLQNIPTVTGQASLTGLNEALLPLFANGRVLLLVDGLDEIHSDAHRASFVEHLEAFLDEYKSIRLVVTSREAGFNLVAPCVSRFCERWRVAPLQPDAIRALCAHWHLLMKGDSTEAKADGEKVSRHLIGNASLLRLAENPLLLTMLLVVKHGAGRLPPDRVSLYSRAIEVLLDTWNIKGHAPLNTKEAVPQLAFMAYEMMRAGKQTATEKELLALLEDARDKVPQIRRYAKDTPYEFLKRVELRSSLVVEAGHQREGIGTVPFYQFRHLTFQEYLAAVAVAEGHYIDYQKGDTVMKPLAPHITAEGWKEVVPMAAVLARKQAEPLIAALVETASELRSKLEAGTEFPGQEEWNRGQKAPAAVARLIQCLVEEAEASPETLNIALELVALFARGCRSEDDWETLARGPYGEELVHKTWLLYSPMHWPEDSGLLNTYVVLEALRPTMGYWATEGRAELQKLAKSDKIEDRVKATARALGTWWYAMHTEKQPWEFGAPLATIESLVQSDDSAYWAIGAWAVGLGASRSVPRVQPPPATLDRLVTLWLSPAHPSAKSVAAFALASCIGFLRETWKPSLTEGQLQELRRQAMKAEPRPFNRHPAAALVIAFHAGDTLPQGELAAKVAACIRTNTIIEEHGFALLKQMGELGQRHIQVEKGEVIMRRKKPFRQPN